MQPESGDMDRDRVQFLQEALAANPDDTFARYALALERRRRRLEQAAQAHRRYPEKGL